LSYRGNLFNIRDLRRLKKLRFWNCIPALYPAALNR